MKIAKAEPISDVSMCEAVSENSSQQLSEEKTQITLSHPLPENTTQAHRNRNFFP